MLFFFFFFISAEKSLKKDEIEKQNIGDKIPNIGYQEQRERNQFNSMKNLSNEKPKEFASLTLQTQENSKPKLNQDLKKQNNFLPQNLHRQSSESHNVNNSNSQNVLSSKKGKIHPKFEQKNEKSQKIQLISINPNRIEVSGRTEVVMNVLNAKPGLCFGMFDKEIVAGEIDSNGCAMFHAPMHSPGMVTVKFSKDRIKWYGGLEFEYYEEKHANVIFISIIVGLFFSGFIGIGIFFFITNGSSSYTNSNQAVPPLEKKRKLKIGTNHHKLHTKQRIVL